MTDDASLSSLPKHIAIIMDGNGRWAKNRFLPRIAGHKAGVETVRAMVKHCMKRGIKILTLFAFSSENWRRPMPEVSYLMDLFLKSLEREVSQLHKDNIQLRFIGNRTKLNKKLQQKIRDAETLTAQNQQMILQIAVDYGGQWDICEAVKQIARKVEVGSLNADDISQDMIAKHLSFADLADPDLLIRTSGEMRISNFMLWQLAYAELFFTQTFWPDFTENELDAALTHYAKRERRFGQSTYDVVA